MKTHTQLIKLLFAALLLSTLVLVFPHSPAADTLEEASTAYATGNYQQVFEILKPLAENDNASAQYNLGVLYARGQGVPQDFTEAAKWYQKAAEQGLAEAQYNLGVRYDRGQEVQQDFTEAAKWYQSAAEQGEAKSQYNLGVLYSNGRGVSQDYKEAVKWYQSAAEQGHVFAQYNLGVVYHQGQGEVPQGLTEALKWYQKAADQGLADAQYGLGIMYANGQGVPRDYVDAHRWFNLSASSSQGQSQKNAIHNRGLIETLITPEELAEARKRAREWKPKPAQ